MAFSWWGGEQHSPGMGIGEPFTETCERTVAEARGAPHSVYTSKVSRWRHAGLRAWRAGGVSQLCYIEAMSSRFAFYFFYFWFSVPGGREANA
jgi:hypothetical protein